MLAPPGARMSRPRRWHEVAVLVPRPLASAIGGDLLAAGATGVQEDHPPGFVPRYRQPWDRGPSQRPPRRVLLRAWFTSRLENATLDRILDGRALAAPEWTELADEDWSETWKENFRPVHISDRLVVAAPWHDVPGALLIEPGNAFGTGEHVTTRACLHAIDRYARPDATLLDVGCGSGILALAGARLGMAVVGVDTDPDAVLAADAAARLNGLSARFSTSRLTEFPTPFDLVVANLYAEVLAELAPDLLRLSAGPIACAGILADRADLVRDALSSRATLEEAQEDGWVAFVFGPP